jgi:hypothetical protein
MELLATHNQGVANLPSHDEEDYFLILNIIQDPEVTHPQLELCHRVGPEPLDRICRRRRLVAEPRQDGGLDRSPITGRQILQLPLGFAGDRDSEGHR